MDPHRYRIVKQAFAEVTRVPAAERDEVLRRVCGDDEELRREVEALLEHDRSAPAGVLGDEAEPKRPEPGTPSSSSFDGDFAPGQVLIGRYRIVALVGEGGMGQVYRADDLVLGQPVAVKFLPEHLARREEGLERFRAEVRHAREVTHPNVARVHDIGEVDGRQFLTMEFVDGEDLASLIKRIGRLPGEKASQIAQQVCSALAEAHRKGVLHRDLKPANVMLDGEGRVRLTDFGLAVAVEAEGESRLAGTPQYMAPEQLSGVAASVRSEVYSLGLLLYELYTGRRALRGRTLEQLRLEHEEGGPDPPSSHLEGLDPGVDTVLTRCLARDPALRPASVSEVARALPGGDPLAAALAAGVTPAPELVAAAGSDGATPARTVHALYLAWIALALAGIAVSSVARRLPLVAKGEQGPAVLRDRVRSLLAEVGYTTPPADDGYWYEYDEDLAKTRLERAASDGRMDGLPSPILFQYRQSPKALVCSGHQLSLEDPAPTVPGMLSVTTDATGRLLRLAAVPGGPDDPGLASEEAPVEEGVWRELLQAAGLGTAELEDADARFLPPMPASDRRAWKAEADGNDRLRVRAAGLGGRPVYFHVERGNPVAEPEAGGWGVVFIFLGLIPPGLFLAWRNLVTRRGDRRGAWRFGLFVFVVHVAEALGQSDPPQTFGLWLMTFIESLGYPLFFATNVAAWYLALEPIVRRRWPTMLIGWTRVLTGRLADPRVGREGLVGGVAFMAFIVLAIVGNRFMEALGLDTQPISRSIEGLRSAWSMLAWALHLAGDAPGWTLLYVLFLVFLRAVLRIRWLVCVAWIAVNLLMALMSGFVLGELVSGAAFAVFTLWLLLRYGALAMIVGFYCALLLTGTDLTLDPSSWQLHTTIVAALVLLALGTWCWRAALGGRPVFARE